MRFLSQVVKVAVGQLSAFGGNLHSETSGDAVGALSVHQSEPLEVAWRKDRRHLREHICKCNQADCRSILEKEAKPVYQKT